MGIIAASLVAIFVSTVVLLVALNVPEKEIIAKAAPPYTDTAPLAADPLASVAPSPSSSPVPPPSPVDPDRPPGALDLGEAAALDGISVTATSIERVTPADGMVGTGFVYLGVQMSFTNTSSGPQEVFPTEQVRLENPYVATVRAQTVDVNEGDTVPWGAFRPGTTVSGYVVFALPDRHAALEGFGIYFEDFTGEEIVWWPGIPA